MTKCIYAEIDPEHIRADSNWNARSGDWKSASGDEELHSFEDLIASIDSSGQDDPVVVRPLGSERPTLDFGLVAGFRRFEAIKEINRRRALEECPRPMLRVRAWIEELSDEEARVRNMRENIARENLKRPDVAWGVYQAVEAQPSELTLGQRAEIVARRVGLSAGYVTQLHRIVSGLTPKLLNFWRAAPFPASIELMMTVSRERKERDQVELYRRLMAERGGSSKPSKRPVKTDANRWFRVEAARVEAAGYAVGTLVRHGAIVVKGKILDAHAEALAKIPMRATREQRQVISEIFRRNIERGKRGDPPADVRSSGDSPFEARKKDLE